MTIIVKGKVYTISVYAALVIEAHSLDLDWIAQAVENEAKEEDLLTGVSIHEKWIRLLDGVYILQVTVDHKLHSVLGIFVEFTD
jgi:hypothetical protein